MARLRSEGEHVRIAHEIDRMRAMLDALERTLDVDAPPSPDVGQAIAGLGDIACTLAKIAAYMTAESDRENENQEESK